MGGGETKWIGTRAKEKREKTKETLPNTSKLEEGRSCREETGKGRIHLSLGERESKEKYLLALGGGDGGRRGGEKERPKGRRKAREGDSQMKYPCAGASAYGLPGAWRVATEAMAGCGGLGGGLGRVEAAKGLSAC